MTRHHGRSFVRRLLPSGAPSAPRGGGAAMFGLGGQRHGVHNSLGRPRTPHRHPLAAVRRCISATSPALGKKKSSREQRKKRKERARRKSMTKAELEAEHQKKLDAYADSALFRTVFAEGHGLFMCNVIADTDFDIHDLRAMDIDFPPNVNRKTGEILYGPNNPEEKEAYERQLERDKEYEMKEYMKKRFGEKGHDYKLSKDAEAPGEDDEMEEKQVDDMLSRRLFAKLQGDFDGADKIMEDLREYGVHVDDEKKEWRADNKGYRSRAFVKGFDYGSRQYLQKRFGPRGHDYQLAEDAGPKNPECGLSEEEMHEMISARLLAKLDRKFERADRIHEELRKHGVRVDDDRREWRADGRVWRPRPPGADVPSGHVRRSIEEKFGPLFHEDEEDAKGHDGSGGTTASGDPGKMKEEAVYNRLTDRLVAKLNKDHDAADQILKELREQGVHVDDDKEEWSVDGETFYEMPSANFGDVDASEGEDFLHSHAFDDEILDKAEEEWLKDSEEWLRDGEHDDDDPDEAIEAEEDEDEARSGRDGDPSRNRGDRGRTGRDRVRELGLEYRLAPGSGPPDPGSGLEEERVLAMLMARLNARLHKDYDRADRILKELRGLGVDVDDDRMEYSFRSSRPGVNVRAGYGSEDYMRERFGPKGHDYELAAEAGPLMADFVIDEDDVHEMISARLKARLEKDYERADEIQKELRDVGVYLDDDRREWRGDGRSFLK